MEKHSEIELTHKLKLKLLYLGKGTTLYKVDEEKNNYKYWHIQKIDDNSYKCIWGRIDKTKHDKEFHTYGVDSEIKRKIREKTRKGYKEL